MEEVKTLFSSGNKINAINFDFVQKLDFYIWKTSIEAQNINDFILETLKIIIADFEVSDKVNKARFF